jgi:hypothetical protein
MLPIRGARRGVLVRGDEVDYVGVHKAFGGGQQLSRGANMFRRYET